jgi:N-ethylmaleimide reductase
MPDTQDPLFQPLEWSGLTLPNRVVMAPLTRSRAGQPGDVPTELMADYYGQRASAGLIVSEATNISPIAKGYASTPGIFTPEQVAGWRRVTDAVHARGGHLVLQLWHCGRVSHVSLHGGESPVAPSAVTGETCMAFGLDDEGQPARLPASPPRALTLEEIRAAVEDYARAAANALAAGFDGVEVHAANGYLPHQFLASNVNRRTDAYGGSLEGRCRFLFDVVEAVTGVVPKGRVGVRLAPLFTGNDIADADPVETQGHVAAHLARLGIGYLHLADTDVMRQVEPKMERIVAAIRPHFRGLTMLNGAFDGARARAALRAGEADLIAFGRPYIANPDLPERLRRGGPFNPPDPETFYGGGARGYTDYPALAPASGG